MCLKLENLLLVLPLLELLRVGRAAHSNALRRYTTRSLVHVDVVGLEKCDFLVFCVVVYLSLFQRRERRLAVCAEEA